MGHMGRAGGPGHWRAAFDDFFFNGGSFQGCGTTKLNIIEPGNETLQLEIATTRRQKPAKKGHVNVFGAAVHSFGNELNQEMKFYFPQFEAKARPKGPRERLREYFRICGTQVSKRIEARNETFLPSLE